MPEFSQERKRARSAAPRRGATYRREPTVSFLFLFFLFVRSKICKETYPTSCEKSEKSEQHCITRQPSKSKSNGQCSTSTFTRASIKPRVLNYCQLLSRFDYCPVDKQEVIAPQHHIACAKLLLDLLGGTANAVPSFPPGHSWYLPFRKTRRCREESEKSEICPYAQLESSARG